MKKGGLIFVLLFVAFWFFVPRPGNAGQGSAIEECRSSFYLTGGTIIWNLIQKGKLTFLSPKGKKDVLGEAIGSAALEEYLVKQRELPPFRVVLSEYARKGTGEKVSFDASWRDVLMKFSRLASRRPEAVRDAGLVIARALTPGLNPGQTGELGASGAKALAMMVLGLEKDLNIPLERLENLMKEAKRGGAEVPAFYVSQNFLYLISTVYYKEGKIPAVLAEALVAILRGDVGELSRLAGAEKARRDLKVMKFSLFTIGRLNPKPFEDCPPKLGELVREYAAFISPEEIRFRGGAK